MDKAPLVTVLGPTAAGKTTRAAHLARTRGGEIISADSRQVYRGMDIGTGKDYGDYLVDGIRVPVHLIDILDAGHEYNVYQFKLDFHRAFAEVTARGRVPVLCGGSGLYIESVLKNYKLLEVPVNPSLRADLETRSFGELKSMLSLYGPLHNRTDTVNRARLIRAIEIAMYQSVRPEREDSPAVRSMVLGVSLEREVRRRRITERLQRRLKEGLVAEVEGLLGKGIPADKLEYYGLEYRYVTRYIRGELIYDEMVSQLRSAIHQFAKRQMTYFRGMERRGTPIRWIDGQLPPAEWAARAVEILHAEGYLPELPG